MSRWRPRKKNRFAGPEIFQRFETDLNFLFSEIKVQIKRPNAVDIFCVRETFNDMINIIRSIKFESIGLLVLTDLTEKLSDLILRQIMWQKQY